MVSMGESLAIGIVAGLGVMLVRWLLAVRRAKRHSPLTGSIARVVEWHDGAGRAEVLSGSGQGTVVAARCAEPTPVGEHVVLLAERPDGWRVVHLDEADDEQARLNAVQD